MMQIVTCNIPAIYVDAIGKLTEQGLFPSRSEAIRVALRDFLKSELGMVESLLDLNENEGKVAVAVQAAPVQKKLDMWSCRAGWGAPRPGPNSHVKAPSNNKGVSDISDAQIASIKSQIGL